MDYFCYKGMICILPMFGDEKYRYRGETSPLKSFAIIEGKLRGSIKLQQNGVLSSKLRRGLDSNFVLRYMFALRLTSKDGASLISLIRI